jgi:hypothetical protein
MARFTQYIGLSPEAWEFLEGHKYNKIHSYKMTEGICMEPVIGSLYECTIAVPGRWCCLAINYTEDEKVLYIEVVQSEPWDSGPMIFTQLKNILTGEIIGAWTENQINNY